MGQNGEVGEAGLTVAGEGAAGFGHLHEAEDAFVHAGAAGGGEDDDGFAFGGGGFDGAGDFFADDGAHAGAEEAEVHDGDEDGDAFDGGAAGDDGFLEAGFGLVGFDFVEVAFEAEGVDGVELGVHFLEAVVVNEAGEALGGTDGEMVVALGADAKVLHEGFLEEAFAAGGAFDPEALWHVLLFFAEVG